MTMGYSNLIKEVDENVKKILATTTSYTENLARSMGKEIKDLKFQVSKSIDEITAINESDQTIKSEIDLTERSPPNFANDYKPPDLNQNKLLNGIKDSRMNDFGNLNNPEPIKTEFSYQNEQPLNNSSSYNQIEKFSGV